MLEYLYGKRFGSKSQTFSETSAYKIQRPGNYPEENILHALILKLSEMNIYSNVIIWVRKRECYNMECTVYVWFCHGRNLQRSKYIVTEVRIS
jgi:hypothetical protein